MVEYLANVRRMEKCFDGFEVRYVPRLNNHDANHLPWIASSRVPTPPDVIMVKLSKPSVKPAERISEADLMVIGRSISPHPLQYGESTSLVFCQGVRRIQILVHRNRPIHQMNGSYASGEHNTRSNSQVPAEHHIQIRCAPKSLDRQRNSVQRSEVCKMLR
jgi:hypothetical protein